MVDIFEIASGLKKVTQTSIILFQTTTSLVLFSTGTLGCMVSVGFWFVRWLYVHAGELLLSCYLN